MAEPHLRVDHVEKRIAVSQCSHRGYCPSHCGTIVQSPLHRELSDKGRACWTCLLPGTPRQGICRSMTKPSSAPEDLPSCHESGCVRLPKLVGSNPGDVSTGNCCGLSTSSLGTQVLVPTKSCTSVRNIPHRAASLSRASWYVRK